jgi:hypothetical protein
VHGQNSLAGQKVRCFLIRLIPPSEISGGQGTGQKSRGFPRQKIASRRTTSFPFSCGLPVFFPDGAGVPEGSVYFPQ